MNRKAAQRTVESKLPVEVKAEERVRAGKRSGTVLVVDDHPVVRAGLTQHINQTDDLAVCGEASGAAEAFRMYQQTQPDVVLLDLTLTEGSGMDLIQQILAANDRAKILVASMHDEEIYAERVLRAGAMGYIAKDEPIDQMLAAIREVLRGRIYLSNAMASRLLNMVVRGEEPAVGGSPVDRLSNRELEVYELIGQGMTTRQIAEKLHLSPKTIETHREHIKAKLHIENNNQLVHFATQWQMENR